MIDLFISVRLIPYPLEPRGEAFNYSNYRIRGMIKNTLYVPKLIVSLHCICLFCSEYRQWYIRNCIHVPSSSCCKVNCQSKERKWFTRSMPSVYAVAWGRGMRSLNQPPLCRWEPLFTPLSQPPNPFPCNANKSLFSRGILGSYRKYYWWYRQNTTQCSTCHDVIDLFVALFMVCMSVAC